MHTTKDEILNGNIYLKLAQYKDAFKISDNIRYRHKILL